MIREKISLEKGSEAAIPLYHEVQEGKAELSLRIVEEGGAAPVFSIENPALKEWLQKEESQIFDKNNKEYSLFHKNSVIYVKMGKTGKAVLELEVNWNDSALCAVVKNKRKGFQTPPSVSLREKENAVERPSDGRQDKELRNLREECARQKLLIERLNDLLDISMQQEFHDNGQYAAMLSEMEKNLKKGPGQEQYKKWREKQEELENRRRDEQKNLENIRERFQKEQELLELIKKQSQEAEKILRQADQTLRQTETIIHGAGALTDLP